MTAAESVPADAAVTARDWVAACELASLTPERGAAVLIEAGEQGAAQVAVFLLHSGEVMAVGNRDPRSGANVMARGLIGTRDGTPTVCSPMFKDTFDLATGRCMSEGVGQANPRDRATPPGRDPVSTLDLKCHAVRVVAGVVMVSTGSPSATTV